MTVWFVFWDLKIPFEITPHLSGIVKFPEELLRSQNNGVFHEYSSAQKQEIYAAIWLSFIERSFDFTFTA